ncbi:MAG: hypothetical protein QOH71_539 [Blastocatellia bacterium]|jgi:hypothetical protein|nr:hypothetical protein [Blastocatellia bacterium]
MRKSVLLISGVGIGAGLLYALTRGTKQTGETGNGKGNGKTQPTNPASSNGANGREANVRSIDTGASMRPAHAEPVIDDLGTNQHDAAELLKTVRDAAFDSNDEKLALALGRPVEEIEAWTSGDGTIDGDVVMKARNLADKRGVEIQ